VLLSAFKKAYSTFDNFPPFVQAIITVFGLILFGLALGVAASIYASVSDAYATYRANHLAPAEHLQTAHGLCPEFSGGFTCIPPKIDQAIGHLKQVPPNVSEYTQAAKLLSSLESRHDKLGAVRKQQEQERAALIAKQQAERARLMNQSKDESFAQMLRNSNGEAHDSFICSISTENAPIMSFDYGHYWWIDDRRCTAQQEQERRRLEQTERQQRELERKRRDEDAELASYWPTTLRVDTDMDSFWLPSEERTCQTYPDDKGRIVTVACNATGSHRDHNIPVKFWGGVDRNTVSDWKCRRESDEFVCRAMD